MSERQELRDADGKLVGHDKLFGAEPSSELIHDIEEAAAMLAQRDEEEHAWKESVADNLSALIGIVTKLAGMDEDQYKTIVLRIRSMRDQMNAEDRDAAGQAAE